LWLGAVFLAHMIGRDAIASVQILFSLLGVACGLQLAYPRRPRQISMAALTLLLGLSLWSLATFSRSLSLQNAWRSASELLLLTCAAGLAAAFFTSRSARRLTPYLVSFSALILLGATIWSFLAADLSAMFSAGRLVYPTSSPSTTAGLHLVLLWPLLWVAIDQRQRSLLRGLALGLAFGLGCLAYLTRSSAAVWAVALTVLLAILLTPARLRLLFYLLVPCLLSVWAFPGLDVYHLAEAAPPGARGAVFILIVGSVVCAGAGIVLSLLERWIQVSDRMRIIFGLAVAALIAGGLVHAQLTAPHLLEAPLDWARQGLDQWLAAAEPARSAFARASLMGGGAGQADATTPMPVRLAADLGIVGLVLSSLVLLLFLMAVLGPRFSAGWYLMRSTWLAEDDSTSRTARWGRDPSRWGLETHILLSAVLWLTGSSIDGSWFSVQSALPVLILAAFALAQIDGSVGAAFPRLGRALTTAAAQEPSPTQGPREMSEDQAGDLEATVDRAVRGAAFSGLPRAHRHLERRRRLERRRVLRARQARRYRPPGPLSSAFRTTLIAVSAVLLLLSLPEAAHDLALHLLRGSAMAPEASLTWASRAQAAFPFSEAPLMLQGEVYLAAANRAQEDTSADRHAALLDNLALATTAFEQAADADPTSWAPLHAAALSLERMAEAAPTARNPASLFAPGEAALSLADSPVQIQDCTLLRMAQVSALLARAQLDVALALNRAQANPALLESAARLRRAAEE